MYYEKKYSEHAFTDEMSGIFFIFRALYFSQQYIMYWKISYFRIIFKSVNFAAIFCK